MSVAVQPSVGVQCDLGQKSQPDVVDQEVQCDLGQESQPRVTSDTWLSINRTWITGSEARRFPVHDYLNSETGDDTVASTLVVHGIPNAVPQREVIEYFQQWGPCFLKTPEKDRKFWATYHGGKSWYGFVEFFNLTGADLLHVGLNLKHVIRSHELWVRPRPVNVLSIIVKSVPKAITKEHIIDHYKQIGRCWFQWNFSGLGNVWSAFLDRDMWTGFLQCESEDVLQDVLAAEREVRGVELKMERWSYQSHQLLLEEAKNKRNSERKTGDKGKRERDKGKGDGTGDRGKGGGKGGKGDGKGDSKGDGNGDSKGDSKGGGTDKGDSKGGDTGKGDGNGDEKGEPNDGWSNWQRDPSKWHFMTWTHIRYAFAACSHMSLLQSQNIDPARRPLTGHGAARIELFLKDDLTLMECGICILRGVLAQDGFASRCHTVEMLMKLFAYLLFDDATVPKDLTLRRRSLGDGVSVENEAGWSIWQRDQSQWHRMKWAPQNTDTDRHRARRHRPGYGAARVELSLRDDLTEMTGGIKIHKGVMAQDCFANRCHNVELLMKWLASLLFYDTIVPDDLNSFLQQKGLSN